MAQKVVSILIKAEISAFKRDMAVAASAARKAAKETEDAGVKARSGIGKLTETANKHEKAWSQVSTGLIAGGVAIVGGLTMATKAAMTWESAWTGVLKTVEGSPAQLGRVEDGLRGLAKTLPSTHTEIAAVAEAAGQLGVKTDDVVGFTKVMIDLGQSTNLTAEEGATSLARFSNVMGTSTGDVGRLGATLVGLGNNYATTESEIMAMSMRLAGAGKQIGLSEGQTMGLAAAMSSVGIEAEAGGSAMSLTMKRIGKAVDEGDKSLDVFAQTSGMTAEQFATLWKEDAAAGIEAFAVGLGKAGDAGESMNAILDEVGIKGIRESDAMLRLASAGELLGSAMSQGAKEYESGMALIEEANKRYETAESKIRIAWNNITDAAIDAGAIILPVVAALAESVAEVASAFGDLPAPVQTFLVAGGAIVGVAMLAAGGLMKLSTSAMSTVVGMRALAADSPKAVAALGKLAKVAGALAVLATVGPTIAAMVPSGAAADADKVSAALLKIGVGGETAKAGIADIDKMFTAKGGFFDGLDVSGIEDAFKVLGNRGVADNVDLILSKTLSLGTRGSSNIEFAKKNFEQLDAQLALMNTNGNADSAAKSYEAIAESARNAGVDQSILTEHFPEYTKALSESSAETEQAAAKASLLGAAMGSAVPITEDMAEGLAEIGVSADGSITAIDKLLATLWQLSDGTLDVRAANRAVEDTFRSMTETIKKNGKSLDETTAKGSENQANLDAYIGTLKQRTNAIATAVDENGELVHSDQEVQDSMTKSYEQAIKAAGKFGVFGKEAQTLARDLLGIPKDVTIETWLEDFATDRANQITGALDGMPERKDIKVFVSEDGTTKLTQAQIDAIMGQTVSVEVTEDGTVLNVQGKINGVTDGDARLLVSDDGTVSIVQNKVNTVKDGAAKVNVTDDGTVSWVQGLINNISGKSVTVNTHYTSSGSVGGQSGPGAKATPGRNAGKALGGRAPGLADGGRVPRTGLGTDKVMGINSAGIPHVWVDDREWVINRRSSDKHDSLLDMINRDDPRVDQLKGLAGLASGGRAGSYTVKRGDTLSGIAKQFGTTWRELQRINKIQNADRIYAGQTIDLPGGGASKAKAKPAPAPTYSTSRTGWAEKERDQDAREVKAATAALTAAKRTKNDKKIAAAEKNLDKAKKSYDDSKERVVRLREKEFDLRRDLKRGNIVDAFTSGSGMSVVDQLFDQSNNKDLSKKQRATLRSTAYSMESQLLKLEKQADSLGVAADKANSKLEDLASAQKGVQSSMVGAFDLGGLAGQKDAYGYQASVGKKGLLNYGKSMASGAKKLSSKVAALQKAGFHPSMIEQVISEWTSSGTFELADAMLSMNKSERSSFNSSFKSVERYGLSTGTSLTNAMAKGGINAAEGLVKGLTSQQKKVDNAFYKLGKDAEKSFKRSLGIKSPSTVMFGAGVNVGEGAELGILSKVSDVQGAMGMLAEAPAFSVPPSAEVARYAAQPASTGVVIDYDRLAQAMTNVQLNANLQIDRKQAGTLVQAGQKFNGNH